MVTYSFIANRLQLANTERGVGNLPPPDSAFNLLTITALGLIQSNIRFNFIPRVNVSPVGSHVYNCLLARSLSDSKVSTNIVRPVEQIMEVL